MVEVLLE